MQDNTQFDGMAVIHGTETYTLGAKQVTATAPIWPIYVLDRKAWTARLFGAISRTPGGLYYYGFAGSPGQFYDVDDNGARIAPGMRHLYGNPALAFQMAIVAKLPEPELPEPETFVVETEADRYTVGAPLADGARPVYRYYGTPHLAGHVVEIDGRYAVRLIDAFGGQDFYVDEEGFRCSRDRADTYTAARYAVAQTFSPRGA